MADYTDVTSKPLRRPPSPGKSPVRTVRLRPELVDAVQQAADGRTFGYVVSEALAEWLERRGATAA